MSMYTLHKLYAVRARMFSMSKVDHQVLVQWGTTHRYFSMNEPLLFPNISSKTC